MGIQSLTYLDLSLEERRAAVQRSRVNIINLLSNPLLTAEQRDSLTNKLKHLEEWGNGTLPVSADALIKTPPEEVKDG